MPQITASGSFLALFGSISVSIRKTTVLQAPGRERSRAPAFRLDALLAGGGGPGQSARGPVPEMREGAGKAHSRPWGHRGQDSRGQAVTGHEVGCMWLAPGAHGHPQSLHAQRQPRGGWIRGALT